ncbi:MAG: M42 family metallopeptidase [Candidatus Aenigmatarchaeota archaeon]
MEILKRLVEAPAISGAEKNVRDVIAKEIKPYVDEIKIDRIGNLIARKGSGKPKIMLVAHMDQIGLIVKHITEKGFIKFEAVGGWDEKILPGTKVRIYGSKGPVIGVIGTKPIHIQRKEDTKTKPAKLDELYIDVGVDSQKDAESLGIQIGDFISIHGSFEKLASKRITGYGFDNKLGCRALIEIIKNIKPSCAIYAVFSVQEEIGLIGVRGSAFGIDPDVVIGIDTTIAGGTPDLKPEDVTVQLGKGPALVIKDEVSIINPKIKQWLTEVAKKAKIPLQLEVIKGGASDASITPIIREGIPSGTVAIPTRYVHTSVEVADWSDLENSSKLIIEAIKTAKNYLA